MSSRMRPEIDGGRILRAHERGDAEVFGMLSFAPLLMAIATLIAVAALFRATQTTTFAAARECSRVASAHLDGARAAAAGVGAAWTSLAGSEAPTAFSSVAVSGHGGPGTEVRCDVRSRIVVAGLPLAGWFGIRDADVVAGSVALVEKHKSR